MAELIILSDIHANFSALKSVIEECSLRYDYDSIAILGDIVNYGMSPNEVIKFLKEINNPIIANLYGNHEKALFDGDTSHFSTERGKEVLKLTKMRLSDDSQKYILSHLAKNGVQEMQIGNKKILFVHGTLSDPFWGKMTAEEMANPIYAKYDYVISGHSHVPNFTEKFYEDKSMPEYRNRKRTIFLNPGSVGQPRNHNPRAQYLFVDTEKEIFHFNSVEYDVEHEQSLYDGANIDSFYKIRLTNGI